VKFTTTRYGTNNLNPTYKLSSVEIRPPTPKEFRRDPLSIDDIEGTSQNAHSRVEQHQEK